MERKELERMIKEVLSFDYRPPFIIAGNWKMNMTIREGKKFLDQIGTIRTRNTVIIFPPYTALAALAGEFSRHGIGYGPQNFHQADSGAYTGEIAIPMIKELGCDYLLVGHSERRQYYNETDSSINRKVLKGLAAGFSVMICIGESLQQRRKGSWKSVLKEQLEAGLKGVTKQELGSVLIAYEPVWAIGTGESASAEQIAETHQYLKGVIKGNFGRDAPLLYGGSVNEKNASDIGKIEGVDGFLIGGASLNPDKFKAIIDISI